MAEKNSYSPNPNYAPKPPPKKEGFLNFLWNSDTNEFLGRTGQSWLGITVFYICFFSGLAAFFALALYIFLQTIDDDRPKWTLGASLIGTNPGVGFRPMPDQDKNVDSSLIWINRKNEFNESYWATELDYFIGNYTKNFNKTEVCSYGATHQDDDVPCRVEVDKMPECTFANNGFGYFSGMVGKVKPCVLIKLNKIYEWKPEPYKTAEDLELAKERGMPQQLVDLIKGYIATGDARLSTLWFSCEGENAADIESIGKLHYYSPGINGEFPGIPIHYFPYLKQDGYSTPFVFVQFENPGIHALINVRCKAWAKNIVADPLNRAGLVHFEFLID